MQHQCLVPLQVSHTWSRKLGDLLTLLEQQTGEDPTQGVHLWLDIVAINQTPYEDNGCLLNDDVANLAKVGSTVQTY
jgi:hypothetical protein